MTTIEIPDGSLFGLNNLPYGVFSYEQRARHVGVAIGDAVLDLTSLAASMHLDVSGDLATGSLNAFMARGRPAWTALRTSVTEWLTDHRREPLVAPHLVPLAEVQLHLPFDVALRRANIEAEIPTPISPQARQLVQNFAYLN